MGSAAAVPTTLVASGVFTPLRSDVTPAYPVRVYLQDPDKFRWEEDPPEGTAATVINGNTAQLQSSFATNPLMSWEVAAKRSENFPIFLLARWLNAGGIKVDLLGLETLAGRDLYHISILEISPRVLSVNPWNRDGNRGKYELYVDPASSLPVRLRYYQETDDKDFFSLVPVDVVYSDFRVTGGFVFPFSVERYIGGKALNVLRLESIQLNGAVTDQYFTIK
jgi:outer membrane lipoprotein-sorting protein